MTTNELIESQKNIHGASGVTSRIKGMTITPARTKKAMGKNISFRIMAQRRKRTTSLAMRNALSGVISGKQTMYKAIEEEASQYNVSSTEPKSTTNQTPRSTIETANPEADTKLYIYDPRTKGMHCRTITISININGTNG
jgi:hypothetical protein